jgi:hypothetical protein
MRPRIRPRVHGFSPGYVAAVVGLPFNAPRLFGPVYESVYQGLAILARMRL